MLRLNPTKEELEDMFQPNDLVRLTGNRQFSNITTGIFLFLRNDRAPNAPDDKPWWRLHLLIQEPTRVKHKAIPLDDIKAAELLSRPE